MIRLISLVATIAIFILFGVRTVVDESAKEASLKFKPSFKQAFAVIPLAVFLFFSFNVFIPANTVGILYSPFSGTREQTLEEGLNNKGFFDKIYKFNTEVHTKSLIGITGQTKDAQYITMDIDIKYAVRDENAYEVFKQYRTMENVDAELIPAVTQRAIETITTQYNIIEALGEKRNEIYKEIENELTTRLATSGIKFESITFVDTDGGEEIEAAIKAEAVAKKEVETAQQELLKIEIDSQKRVVEAQADQEKAKVEAETKIIEAEAEARANQLIASSITQGLIDKIEAEARLEHGWVVAEGGSAIVDARD